jgi:hypothetical protein
LENKNKSRISIGKTKRVVFLKEAFCGFPCEIRGEPHHEITSKERRGYFRCHGGGKEINAKA